MTTTAKEKMNLVTNLKDVRTQTAKHRKKKDKESQTKAEANIQEEIPWQNHQEKIGTVKKDETKGDVGS